VYSPVSPDAVVIDMRARNIPRVIAGAAVSAVLGIAGLIGSISAFADSEIVGGIIALIIGIALTGIALLAIFNWKKVSRPHRLIFERPGVRWDDPQGTPWAIPWSELRGVGISRTKERVVSLSNAVARRTMVRVDFFPANPEEFKMKYQNMAHLAHANGRYRLPFGDAAKLIPIVESGMMRFAPQLFWGVQDEGFTVGLR
jgi:hypothetical protein